MFIADAIKQKAPFYFAGLGPGTARTEEVLFFY